MVLRKKNGVFWVVKINSHPLYVYYTVNHRRDAMSGDYFLNKDLELIPDILPDELFNLPF